MTPLLSPAQGCLFRAPLTGGAWLVMSREAARLARTNRLPPLILYDVAVPPSHPSIISPPCLSQSLTLPLPLSPGSFLFSSVLRPRVVIYQASARVMATEVLRSILPLPMCQKPHLLHPSTAAEDMPISRPALSLEKCHFLAALSGMELRYIM